MADGNREIDLNLTVTPYGDHGLLHATSSEMPNLLVTGTDEEDLWTSIGPVVESLFKAQGKVVQTITKDRKNGPRHLRVHVEVSNSQ